jgi:hypothetical protein
MALIEQKRIDELRIKLKGIEKDKKRLVEQNALFLEKAGQQEQDRSLLMTSEDRNL